MNTGQTVLTFLVSEAASKALIALDPFPNHTFPSLNSLVEQFLPVIAVAYDFAPSFSDPKALSFTMDRLFSPKFGRDLSSKLLDAIKIKGISGFNVFSATDNSTGLPMNPLTFELFDVEKYLPEIRECFLCCSLLVPLSLLYRECLTSQTFIPVSKCARVRS